MLTYSIIKRDELIFGPIYWCANTFSEKLFNLGFSVSLPIEPPSHKITFLNDYSIIPTETTIQICEADEIITDKFDFIIEEDLAYYSLIKRKLSAEEITTCSADLRSNLFVEIAKKRRKFEESGILVKINEIPCMIDSDRDSQGMIHRTFAFMTQPVVWKLRDNLSWVTINKEHMQLVIQTLLAHIQIGFKKEAALQVKLNSLSISELKSFNVDNEWELINVT